MTLSAARVFESPSPCLGMLFSFSSLTGFVPVSLCLNLCLQLEVSSHVLWCWVSLHFLSCLTQFLVDLLQGFVPVWLIVMPSASWNRLFRCFEDCRVEIGGILDRLCVDVSNFLKRFQPAFL